MIVAGLPKELKSIVNTACLDPYRKSTVASVEDQEVQNTTKEQDELKEMEQSEESNSGIISTIKSGITSLLGGDKSNQKLRIKQTKLRKQKIRNRNIRSIKSGMTSLFVRENPITQTTEETKVAEAEKNEEDEDEYEELTTYSKKKGRYIYSPSLNSGIYGTWIYHETQLNGDDNDRMKVKIGEIWIIKCKSSD